MPVLGFCHFRKKFYHHIFFEEIFFLQVLDSMLKFKNGIQGFIVKPLYKVNKFDNRPGNHTQFKMFDKNFLFPEMPKLLFQKWHKLDFYWQGAPQLFQASATVRHCSTSCKVTIQLDHFCIGDWSNIDVHKFIWA